MNIGKIPVESTLVGGFRFTLLHTFKEYVEVGKMLNNCLTDWKPHENPVVAIYKNNYAIAAVELEGNKVIQVRYAGNKRIESNEHLKESFEKWCRGCGFVCGNYVLT